MLLVKLLTVAEIPARIKLLMNTNIKVSKGHGAKLSFAGGETEEFNETSVEGESSHWPTQLTYTPIIFLKLSLR